MTLGHGGKWSEDETRLFGALLGKKVVGAEAGYDAAITFFEFPTSASTSLSTVCVSSPP